MNELYGRGGDQLPLIEFFCKELKEELKILKDVFSHLERLPHAMDQFKLGYDTAYKIKGAARIVHYNDIVHLAMGMEEYFRQLKDNKRDYHKSDVSLFREIIDILLGIANTPPSEVNKRIQDSQGILRRSTQDVVGLCSTQKVEKAQPLKEAPTPPRILEIDDRMKEIFKLEVESNAKVLNEGLINVENRELTSADLSVLMRAAHSIKGAARVVGFSQLVRLAHVIEDFFVALQQQKAIFRVEMVDTLLQAVDLFFALAAVPMNEMSNWLQEQIPYIEKLEKTIERKVKLAKTGEEEKAAGPSVTAEKKKEEFEKPIQKEETPPREEIEIKAPPIMEIVEPRHIEEQPKEREVPLQGSAIPKRERVLRVAAQNLNRIVGLAGESLVESRWLYPFEKEMRLLKRSQDDLEKSLDVLRESILDQEPKETIEKKFEKVQKNMHDFHLQFDERLNELEGFIRRYSILSDRLYQEVLESRMRPFSDGIEGFARLARDLARDLNKKVTLEIKGKNTPVDRDILEKLESPLNHLLRNAIDHGIETPVERIAAGKPEEGLVRIEAHHRGGMLVIMVSDDGKGLDLERIRKKVIREHKASPEMVQKLSDAELVDFLFLAGFSTSKSITELSGRGMGLNTVQEMVQEVGGFVRVNFQPGHGTTFQLQLPLTLSVIHALIVSISGEPYAFPLTRIEGAIYVSKDQIQVIENKQYFTHLGQNVGIVSGSQILELQASDLATSSLPVILLSDRFNTYGVVVDDFFSEKELVVQDLDPLLGKVSDISAGALLEDGSPVLIIDVDDMIRSIDKLLSGGHLGRLKYIEPKEGERPPKRILIVDDSLTVREVESRLLQNQGYRIETAINGMDGWNAVRISPYDLVITDVDMPRMNGLELVKAIKSDVRLRNIPVMIVTYKESDEDRRRGLEAGVDFYLTKSSFHDDTLVKVVESLIGKA